MNTGFFKFLPALPLLLVCGRLMAEPGEPVQISPSVQHASEAHAGNEAATEADKCEQVPIQDKLPEKVQSGVHEFSCRTFRWFDSLFGDSRDFEEEAISGKLSVGLAWNEFDSFEGRLRYRVHSDLPNLNTRWDAFFGRVDEDAYISGTQTLKESAHRQGISDSDDSEWLLGLGYKGRSDSGDGWDYSVGLRFRTPVRLYVKSRYRKAMLLSPTLDLRYRQTFFWRDGTGYGTTTHIDSARKLSAYNVLRWEILGTVSEDTDGLQWWTGNTWYHNLGNRRGISLLTFARGETDKEVALQEYGFELTWRRQVAREWLYLNAGPTLTWPQENPGQPRKASWGFALLMEFEFGHFRGLRFLRNLWSILERASCVFLKP